MLKKLFSRFANGILAGILISVGGSVFLSACALDSGDIYLGKIVGAVLFSVALICICIKEYSLYTGRICYMLDAHDKDEWSTLLLGLLGNTVATVLCGVAIRYAIPGIGVAAEAACSARLAGQTLPQTFIRAIFCGIMVYLSVAIYKEKESVVGIIFCIPTFVLSGFEHSIADIFYFGASGIVSARAFVFIAVVLAGNTVGGLLFPALRKLGEQKK